MQQRLEVAGADELLLRILALELVHALHDVEQVLVGRHPREREAGLDAPLLVFHRIFDELGELGVGLGVAPLCEPVGRADVECAQRHAEKGETASHHGVHGHVDLVVTTGEPLSEPHRRVLSQPT